MTPAEFVPVTHTIVGETVVTDEVDDDDDVVEVVAAETRRTMNEMQKMW